MTNDDCFMTEKYITPLPHVAALQNDHIFRDISRHFNSGSRSLSSYDADRNCAQIRWYREVQKKYKILRVVAQDLPALLEEIRHHAIAARLQLLHYVLVMTMLQMAPRDQ